MKIMTVFARRTPRGKTRTTQAPIHLSTREWADLPVHHPHRDDY